MKLFRFIAGTSVFLLAVLFAHAQQDVKNFQVIPASVKQGDRIEIHYNPEGTPLAGLAPVQAKIFLFRDFEWQVDEVEMQMSDSGWVVNYMPPIGTALISCQFVSGDKKDIGKRIPYSHLLMDAEGKLQQSGAYAGWGFLRVKALNEEPEMVSHEALIENEVGLFWVNQELRAHPESRRKMFYEALKIAQKEKPEQIEVLARNDIAFITSLKDVTEQELMKVADVYRNILKDWNAADSLEKIILTKFPNGLVDWDKTLYTLFRAPLVAGKDSLWNDFKTRFSLADARFVSTNTASMYYTKVYKARVFTDFSLNYEYDVVKAALPASPFGCFVDFHRHIVAYPLERLDEQKRTPEQVFDLSQAIMDELDQVASHTKWPEAKGLTLSEWKKKVLLFHKGAYAVHAKLMLHMGDAAGALQYANRVKELYGYKSSDFNAIYTDILLKNKLVDDALVFVELSVKENAASPEMIQILKQNYVKKNKSDKGFDGYFDGLKSQDKMQKQRDDLLAKLVNKDIPSFALESNKGGKVDLSKLKGKIVVLDFWATWCAPCKAAMPGMQMAVNKYADDKNVAFYFIATDETKADYKELIAKFLDENQYNFNVLFDAKNPDTNKLNKAFSTYSKTFGISGIPQKMIIDAKGKLRWLSSGYMGSPSALADEIAIMVEYLKAEKSI